MSALSVYTRTSCACCWLMDRINGALFNAAGDSVKYHSHVKCQPDSEKITKLKVNPLVKSTSRFVTLTRN